MIAAGQARGEVREGNATMLAGCLLAEMNAYVGAGEGSAAPAGPTFDEMMCFCISSLIAAPDGYLTGESRLERELASPL